jgi:hypothetical protein
MGVAFFCVLHLSTAVGERWIWQLHRFERLDNFQKQPDGIDFVWDVPQPLPPKTLPAEFTDWDKVSDSGRLSRAAYVEVQPLYLFILLHELEASAVAATLLIYINRNTRVVAKLQTLLRSLVPTLIGAAALAPIIRVPCTWTVKYRYFSRDFSEYRWLWKVGETTIQSGVVLFEELAIIIIFSTLAMQYSPRFRKLVMSFKRSSDVKG